MHYTATISLQEFSVSKQQLVQILSLGANQLSLNELKQQASTPIDKGTNMNHHRVLWHLASAYSQHENNLQQGKLEVLFLFYDSNTKRTSRSVIMDSSESDDEKSWSMSTWGIAQGASRCHDSAFSRLYREQN